MTKEEILAELASRGVTILINDYSCGCCGYTNIAIAIDGEVEYEAEAGSRGTNDVNLNSIDRQEPVPETNTK